MIHTMTSWPACSESRVMAGKCLPMYILIEARNVDGKLLSNSKRTESDAF
jgi:hypothetical protein